MILNLVANQKNYERLCQEGKACNTERNVIISKWLCHKHCKFPILVIKIICNLSKKVGNQCNSLFQKQCVKVRFHCRVQFFHADQWKLLLQDNQKWQSPGTVHSGLLNEEARLTSPSQMYAVLNKEEIIMIPLTNGFRLLHYIVLFVAQFKFTLHLHHNTN